MYFIDNDKELTTPRLLKYTQKFLTQDYPKLCNWNSYYNGEQKIMSKAASSDDKPCNKIVVNYCKDIVDVYSGYIIGKPVTYNSTSDITALKDIYNLNNEESENKELLKMALIHGAAYELCYLDEDAQLHFKVLDSKEGFCIYSNTLDNKLMYFVRLYSANDIDNVTKTYIDVYTENEIRHYSSQVGYNTANLINVEQHYFGAVPVSVLTINRESKSIFDGILSMQDAYNSQISDAADDYDSFVDTYLVIKGAVADSDDLAEMKKNRVMLLDSDSDVSYLVKETNPQIIETSLKRLNEQIYEKAKCVDYSDEKFMAQSGIAMQYKMTGMEDNASNIESSMRKALMGRAKLIYNICSLTTQGDEWGDINIIFTRNLPADNLSLAQEVNQLRGLVSTKTLISLLPFIKDADAEAAAVADENSIGLYGGVGE